ncbi:MAG: heparinase II/III family protein, partial [Bryobacteraceae bacterium]
GGRFFHPYGARDRFARATLATCAAYFGEPAWRYPGQDCAEQAEWWLGPQPLPCGEWRDTGSRWFAAAGVAVMRGGPLHAIVDAGPFAAGSGGHSHSDTLSLVVRRGDEDILVDPGTYTYVSDPKSRDWFRGSSAHSTIRIDGLDQGTAAGPFRWSAHPSVTVQNFESSAERDFLDACCAYSGFTHRRRVLRIDGDLLIVHDSIDGPAGIHRIEQFWHLGSRDARRYIALAAAAELLEGAERAWRSPVFGVKAQSFVLRVQEQCTLPARFAAVIDVAGSAGDLNWNSGGELLYQHPRRTLRIRFNEQGPPEVL